MTTMQSVAQPQDAQFQLLHGFADFNLHELILKGNLTAKERLLLMLELSRTVAKMHANGIVHRNLLPSRIFVTKDLHIALIGFDNPKVLLPASLTFVRTAYAPPEATANPNEFKPSYDTFALGVLTFEIWTMTKLTEYKLNVDLLKHAPPLLKALITQCTDTNPHLRCSIHDIVEVLEKLYRSS